MPREVLWAPWRLAYLTEPHQTGCFFCNALRSRQDRRHLVLRRERTAFVLLNKYPYNPGHLMVAPRRHTGDLSALEAGERAALMDLVAESVEGIRKAVAPQGFNVGVNLGKAAGAGVEDHLHVHVVPRWNGDTNFMPMLAETKVMPEHLAATYRRLLRFVGKPRRGRRR